MSPPVPLSSKINLPTKVLIIRNDKLGDFTLSLPSFALLKKYLPETEITALVPNYTRPLVEACPYIDEILIDPGPNGSKVEQKQLLKQIKSANFDVALTLYSTTRIGMFLKRARIPVRIAPATKLAQIFYNHRITQRRSKSLKPEFEYNLDLARFLLELANISNTQTPAPPYLEFPVDEIKQLRESFCQKHALSTEKNLIFIHPGSGGSANNLLLEQYAKLALGIAKNPSNQIIISAGPTEIDIAEQLSALLTNTAHSVYRSEQGLTMFAKHIGFADCFISGSTGPLHVAAALNRPTAGFYPNRRSATSLRWQTINDEDRRLAFSPPEGAEQEDMSTVDIDRAVRETQQLLLRLY